MRRLLAITAFALLALAPAPLARAAIVPGQVIEPASAAVQRFSDLDMAKDGTGALVYIKQDGGVDHIFVSRYVGGAWQAPERVDTGLAQPSRSPSVAAGNGGRVVVGFLNGPAINNGTVRSAVRPSAGAPFALTPDASDINANPQGKTLDLEMDPVSGVAYALYVDFNNDLRAARLLSGGSWTGVGGPPAGLPGSDAGRLDAAPADQINLNNGVPRVAVDGAGNAIIAWSETVGTVEKVFVRGLSGTNLGPVAEATIDNLNGALRANTADMVDVAVDGAGNGYVVFRELFTYGALDQPRAIGRVFAGGAVQAAQLLDGLPSPPGQGAEFPRISVNASGRGLFAMARQDLDQPGANDAIGGTMAGATFSAGARLDTVNNLDAVPLSVATIGDSGEGLYAYQENPGTTEIRVRTRSAAGVLGPETTVSRPELGLISGVGLEASSDAAGNTAVGFAQGAANKAIVAAVIDRPAVPVDFAPIVTQLRFSPGTFYLGSLLPRASVVRRTIPTGTTIFFRASEASKATLTFQRIIRSRKVGRRCVRETRFNRRRAICYRYLGFAFNKIRFNAKAGLNRVRFHGRIDARHRLVPGLYRLEVVTVDSANQRSAVRRVNFRALRKPPPVRRRR